jgi:Tfp pilus assembly protein PilN
MRAVNLVPQDQRRQTAAQRPGSAYVVLGGLAVLLVMAVAYVLTSNQVSSRQADADAARAETQQLQAQAQALTSFTDFSQLKQTRLASVIGVSATRFDWERLMHELSLIMPERSWLQTTDASVAGSSADGTDPAAGTPGAVPSGPSATFVGCTPRQSDVARMMVRMRRMHRVDDVKLNESIRETSGADSTASIDNCGNLYKFDITVTFSVATPPQEAPRGETRVPVSLGGGS